MQLIAAIQDIKLTKLRIGLVLVLAFVGLSFMNPQGVLAQCAGAGSGRSLLNFPTWDQYLDHDATDCHITNFSFPQDLFLVLLALVEIMIRLSAWVAVGFIVYAGFKFMIAQGQPDRIAEARAIIQNAIIGLVISVLSVAIISFASTRFN